MITMTLPEIAKILNFQADLPNENFIGISIDTRTLQPNQLFVAIKGEQFDGHDYIAEAEKKGAKAAIVNRKLNTTIPQIIAGDTIEALGKIAAAWRNQFHFPIVGVTGSSGKTTLKNMIAAIMRAACNNDSSKVIATDGNFNNNIGMPLNLAKINAQHKMGIIEMGTNNFGEISYLTHLVRPQVAVINNAAAAHLQGLQSVAGVARAKGEIFEGLPKDGTAILNRDDNFFDYWKENVKAFRVITFGLKNPADVSATYSEGDCHFTLQTPKGNIEINLPLPGKHNIMNALAATAATLALDISLTAIKQGLENVQAAPGRMRQYVLPNNVRIIDDTYNANPGSTTAAIDTLKNFSGTKILVLGDMRELGPDGKELHFTIGEHAKNSKIDFLFTYGELTENTTRAFGNNAQHFTDREQLMATLKNYLKANTTFLIKGSRSMKMEKVLHSLIPELAHENSH